VIRRFRMKLRLVAQRRLGENVESLEDHSGRYVEVTDYAAAF
jgi:hypothetical protein